MSAAAFEPLAPVLPAAPAASPVSFRGFPSSLEASALRTLIDRAARGYPGEWTATWTSSGVSLSAAGLSARIILAGPPGAVRVSLRGVEPVPEAARSLAVRCRDEAERFARAQTAPSPEPPTPARLHPVRVTTSGESPLAATVEAVLRNSATADSSWSIRWRDGSAVVSSAGCQFRVDASGRVSKAYRDWQDFTTPPPVPAEVVAVADAVRVALASGAQEAA